ncbi:hypothetical protein GcM1_228011, partial [Golovinomyces cichoracearum]
EKFEASNVTVSEVEHANSQTAQTSSVSSDIKTLKIPVSPRWFNSYDRALKAADHLVAGLPFLRAPKTPQLLLLPPPPIPKTTMSSPSEPAALVAVTMTNEQLNRLIRGLDISPQIGNNRDEGIRMYFVLRT